MAVSDTRIKLNTGAEIPAFGLGTWQSEPGKVKAAVTHALKEGYKLIDCAYCYGNEDEVGEGLKEAFEKGYAKREDVFVISKVWATYNTRVAEGLDKSLKSLGLDYVDLFLVHWPILLNPNGNDDKFPKLPDGSRDVIRDWDHREAWKQMEALDTSKAKAIGVSNYSKQYLEQLLPTAKIVPAAIQLENHPWLPQTEVTEYSKEKGIHVIAYSALGSTGSPLATVEPIVKLAEKKGVTPVNVLLSQHVARGHTVLAKSVTPERIAANKDLVKLDAEDIKLLDEYSADIVAKKEWKRYVYPPFGVPLGFPDKP